MHTSNIQNALKRQPFQPFQVVMSSGDKYPVRHPELAIPLKEGLMLAYHEGDHTGLPENWTICSYLHISSLEPMHEKRRRRAS